MDFVRFWIYSYLYIVLTAYKAPFRYKDDFFCIFSRFAWDLEICTSECTPCVSQHSFSYYQMMAFVHFCICSFLRVLIPVPKGQFRYKHYFSNFPCLYTTTCAFIKPVDGLPSFSENFLFIHHTSFNTYL